MTFYPVIPPQIIIFLNITSNSIDACSFVVPVMSELAAMPPDGPDAALASARVGRLARA